LAYGGGGPDDDPWYNKYYVPVISPGLTSGDKLANGDYVGAGADFSLALVELFTFGYGSAYTSGTKSLSVTITKNATQVGTKLGFVFNTAETAAANRLGFFPEEVLVNNGVAEVPIIYMSEVSLSDITIVSNALKTNGVNVVRINSGPIINASITARIQQAYDAGKTFLGFAITKTNNSGNAFILEKILK
jgi:hypothetical protein